jgi:hypothetical protein
VPPLNVVVDPRRAQPQFDPNRAAAKTTTGWQPEKKNKEENEEAQNGLERRTEERLTEGRKK